MGRLLSGQVELPFIDADTAIEERAGGPVPQIFADQGEPAFRVIEHETIAALLAGPPAVLALGGGAVEHPGTRALLLTENVVYLHVDYNGAVARVGGDAGRPMLRRPDLAAVYRRRAGGLRGGRDAHGTHRRPRTRRRLRRHRGPPGSAVPRRTG